MTPTEYIRNVKRTESWDFKMINTRLLHGVLGCGTESGELLDAVKKAIFYNGRTLDLKNVKEEVGDLLWYIAIICDVCGWTMEEVMEQNITKLRIRYPEQFTTEAEKARDYIKEAQAFKEVENDDRAS
jgi:NTP pyrophosphatase (non-canonical NTP hydrolase)